MGFSRNKHASKKQEKSIAADVQGRTQPGSGSSPLYKGDVRVIGERLTEAKTTTKDSYRLSIDTIDKVRAEAAMNGEDWDMQIQFQRQMGQHRKVAVLDWDRYVQLVQEAKSGDNCQKDHGCAPWNCQNSQ